MKTRRTLLAVIGAALLLPASAGAITYAPPDQPGPARRWPSHVALVPG
jgi:hypothetical protein